MWKRFVRMHVWRPLASAVSGQRQALRPKKQTVDAFGAEATVVYVCVCSVGNMGQQGSPIHACLKPFRRQCIDYPLEVICWSVVSAKLEAKSQPFSFTQQIATRNKVHRY